MKLLFHGELMKKAAIRLLFAVVAAATILIVRAASERTLVFTHVNLIDATGAPLLPDMTMVVVLKRITDIEQSSGANIPKNAQVLNAQGKYLIPGL